MPRHLTALALAALLAVASVASAETDWCAARRRTCERSCGGDPNKTDFDCKDKGNGASRSVSCSCEGGGGAAAGPVFAGDPQAALNNPAVDMLKGIGAWPGGAFGGSYDGSSSSPSKNNANNNKGGSSGLPSNNNGGGSTEAPGASPSNPAYLSGAPGGTASKQSSPDVGKAVGIAVGVTAAVCAAIAAATVLLQRRRAAAAQDLPLAMAPPKTVD